MEYFTDSEGLFVFPESIFPKFNSSDVPPTVLDRKIFLISDAPPPPLVDAICKYLQVDERPKQRARGWSIACVQFSETWSPLPLNIMSTAFQILSAFAAQDDPRCSYTLSTLSSLDTQTKEKWLRRAAKLGHPRAWCKAAMTAQINGDYRKAISRLNRGAESNDSACLYELAFASFHGNLGFPKDLHRGWDLLNKAAKSADSDFSTALYVVGKIHLDEVNAITLEGLQCPELDESITGKLDKSLGIDLVKRAAQLGYAPALLRMGFAYNNGDLGFDCLRALRYFSLSADQEVYRVFKQLSPLTDGNACVQLAKWLLCGYENIMKKNVLWSFRFASVGSRIGNATALFALAYFYETGTVVEKDLDMARRCYEQSNKDGCSAAAKRLSQLKIPYPESPNMPGINKDKGNENEALGDDNVSTSSLPYPESPKRLPYPAEQSTLSLPNPSDVSDIDIPVRNSNSNPDLSRRVPSMPPAVPSVPSGSPGTPPNIMKSTPTPTHSGINSVPLRAPEVPPMPATPSMPAAPATSAMPRAPSMPVPPVPLTPAPTESIRTLSISPKVSREQSPARNPRMSSTSLNPHGTHVSNFPMSSQGSLPSIGTRSFSTNPELDLRPQRQSKTHSRSRSTSPLRKIFNSESPQERAEKTRQERRSFTEAALADLRKTPKVPVQPIKQEREPGVAYTFEEMGIKTYTNAKNDKCTVM